ncbi:hypothetical protein OC846_002048 [Tilletia horrida]|uniref:Mitochondrial carrier n=1 Tax=Tilletia horrida TaxID=155126 RepID=A0AAN6GRW8_9BASI|nr:hypothetical protein OC846_002048 [Tilletia horrida]
MNASVFGCYSLALRAQMGPGVSIESATLGQIMIAGMASGVMTALITTPIDLLKVQQQNDVRSAASSTPSTFGLARDIVRKHGFTGLYRGYGATCIRDLGYGPYFFTYELINRTLLSMHKTDPYFPSNQELTVLNASARLSPIELAISGGIAGMVGWAVTFWADTVKTRIQAGQMPDPASSRNVVEPSGRASASAGSGSVQPNPGTSIAESSRTFRKSVISAHESDLLLGGGSRSANVQGTLPSSPTRRNINHTAPVATQGGPLLQWITTRSKFVRVSLNIYRTGGPSAFWVGIGPAMLRAIPTNAVLFIVYEATKSACMKWGL